MATASKSAPTGQQNGNGHTFDDVIDATQQAMSTRQDLLQMRMENEAIMAECRVRPRNFQEIKAELIDQLQAFPDLAENSIYCKPVGKDSNGKQQFAFGLSIRAAEVLAEAYGFNRVASTVTTLDDGKATITASFTDFQKGRIWQDSGVISQFYKAKGGGMVRHADDRFYGLICKAEASRRVREVVLRSVNAGLKAWFYDECNKMIDDLLDDAAVEKMITAFATFKVTLEMLEKFIGRPKKLGWTKADRRNLIGVFNALKEGETTVDIAFAEEKPPAEPLKTQNGSAGGAVSGSDLSSPQAGKQESRPGTPKKEEKPADEPAKEEPPKAEGGDPLAKLRADLEAALALPDGQLTKINQTWAMFKAPANEWPREIIEKGELIYEEIRAKQKAKRGSRSNKEAQKELPGASE